MTSHQPYYCCYMAATFFCVFIYLDVIVSGFLSQLTPLQEQEAQNEKKGCEGDVVVKLRTLRETVNLPLLCKLPQKRHNQWNNKQKFIRISLFADINIEKSLKAQIIFGGQLPQSVNLGLIYFYWIRHCNKRKTLSKQTLIDNKYSCNINRSKAKSVEKTHLLFGNQCWQYFRM